MDIDLKSIVVKWTPRVLAVAIGSYYGLGLAYELGLMALIDTIAIKIIKHYFGYVGIGALMPSVQWYAAWAARFAIGLAVGVIYDLTERIVKACMNCFKKPAGETRRLEDIRVRS